MCIGDTEHKKQIGEREGFYYLLIANIVPLRKEHLRLGTAQMAHSTAGRMVDAHGALCPCGVCIRLTFHEQYRRIERLRYYCVAKHGYIWMTRFLLHGLLMLLGKGRRHKRSRRSRQNLPQPFYYRCVVGYSISQHVHGTAACARCHSLRLTMMI